MRIYDTNTNEPVNAGDAFRVLAAHAAFQGRDAQEAAGMCSELDTILALDGDMDRAIEIFDELDGAGLGLELRP